MKIHSLANDILTKSMVITSKKCPKYNARDFFIRNQSGKKICQFTLTDDGEITALKLKRKYRRKKEGICALFSLKKFLERLGRKENIDYFKFEADEANPNNVVRLYNKFAIQTQELTPFYFWPITSKGQRQVHQMQREIPATDVGDFFSNIFPF